MTRGGRYCPICGCDEVSLWLGGYIGALYRCPDCNYVGPIVIEGESEETRAPESESNREEDLGQS